MSLQQKLDSLAKASAKQLPAQAQAVMKQSTQQLADSIDNRSFPNAGDDLPQFTLPDSSGMRVVSTEITKTGPVVVTFFRGMW